MKYEKQLIIFRRNYIISLCMTIRISDYFEDRQQFIIKKGGS